MAGFILQVVCDVWLQAVRRSHLDDSDSDVDSDDSDEEDLSKLIMWRVKRQGGCKRHVDTQQVRHAACWTGSRLGTQQVKHPAC